jgi:hypothetical protein
MGTSPLCALEAARADKKEGPQPKLGTFLSDLSN